MDQRTCVSCLSDKTYFDESNNKRLWYHPTDDKVGWLCHPCYVRVYFQVYRKKHPIKYKRYQKAYHKTYNDSKVPKRKYQYHKKEKLLEQNASLRKEIDKTIGLLDLQKLRSERKTQGVF
jgi:hypothetical protein